MLHILWMLLKIIGIIILILLGLVLVTLGVAFFVPLRYCASAELDKEIERSTANIKFSWLLHLVSGNVYYTDRQLAYEIKVLGKKMQFDKTDDNDESAVENKQVKGDAVALSEETNSSLIEEKIEDFTDEFKEELNRDKNEDSLNGEAKKYKKSIKKKKTKKESFLKKIKYTFQNICAKIKMLKQKKEKVEAFIKDESHQSAFKKLWKEFGRLMKALRPKKLVVNAHFGFDDPSLTGKILAGFSMWYPFYGDNIRIQPDFENVIIEGDLYLKGKIKVIYAVRMAWNLVWNKDVRITLKDILNWFK